jgi:hypothetical protein
MPQNRHDGAVNGKATREIVHTKETIRQPGG